MQGHAAAQVQAAPLAGVGWAARPGCSHVAGDGRRGRRIEDGRRAGAGRRSLAALDPRSAPGRALTVSSRAVAGEPTSGARVGEPVPEGAIIAREAHVAWARGRLGGHGHAAWAAARGGGRLTA